MKLRREITPESRTTVQPATGGRSILGTYNGADWVVIKPSSGWAALGLKELWQHRELVYFLIWRDIKVRYKQTVLGATWAIIQPVLTMVVFTIFFGELGNIPSDGAPYPIFSYAALIPWTYFANSVAHASQSLTASANLIQKIYFPRLALPVSTSLAGLLDVALSFSVLVVMMIAYGVTPTWRLATIPLFLVFAVVTALGTSIWLSAMNVRYRDIRYVTPFLVQLWMLISPIAYPSSLLSTPWRTLYGLNPMAGVVEGFRWAVLGTSAPPTSTIALSSAVALVLMISGTIFFRNTERTFADII